MYAFILNLLFNTKVYRLFGRNYNRELILEAQYNYKLGYLPVVILANIYRLQYVAIQC